MQQGAPTEAAQTQVNATITQLQGLPAAELARLLERERRINKEQREQMQAQLQAQLQAQAQQSEVQAQIQAQLQELQTQLELLRVQHAVQERKQQALKRDQQRKQAAKALVRRMQPQGVQGNSRVTDPLPTA
mmetsp:Transcript_53492/g.81136  ORF Transcript_53492/g.81136 Transcript_53492/m.81136 type:complete len:132 (-) Transcript_53492:41-436(-)